MLIGNVVDKIGARHKSISGKDKRKDTVINLAKSVSKYLILIFVVLGIFKLYGVDTTSIIASIGVFAAVIGLAFQDILKDLLAGISIIFDNKFAVGDTVEINGFSGTVIQLGLRTTKIKSFTGEIKSIGNSSFNEVINYSLSDAILYIKLNVAYDTNLEKLGYHTGAGGICNLFKLKKELEKIFNKEISKGEISIKMTIIGNNIYEDLTDEKVAEYYNDFYWSDYLATGDAIEKDNEYIKEKYKEIYEKESQFTENEITEIKNGTGIYSKENNKNSAAMQKAYIDCMVIEIGYKNKIFTITSTGEIILETTGEIITNSEIMSIRDAYKVFKFKGDRIIQYIGQEKTVRVPKSIGTVEENYKIKELGYKDSNDSGNIGGYNEYWSICIVNAESAKIKDLLLTEDNQGNETYLDFEEQNYDQIINILSDAGLDLSSVSSFNELKKYMHAYQENGEWYTTYVMEGETIKFVDKNELSGVETVVIPEGIKKVWNYALASDSFLTKVYIPKSLITQENSDAIGRNAFEGASPNLKIYITKPENWGKAEKNIAISKFDGFKDLTAEQFIWSDEEAYIDSSNL